MLGHLAPSQHGAGLERDLVFAAQRLARAGHGSGNSGEILLGGGEQLLAFARSLGSEGAIAANDQTFARIVRRLDLAHVAIVEQRGLQGSIFGESLERRGTQRGQPVEPGGFEILLDARLGDHPAIAHQNHPVEFESLFELGDLRR